MTLATLETRPALAPRPIRVLILEDRSEDAELMVVELARAGFSATWDRVASEAEFSARLEESYDIILADYYIPGGGAPFTARRALEVLRSRGVDVPVIIISGQISEEIAVECMKEGASDYFLKDRLARLGPAVRQALDAKVLKERVRRAEQQLVRSQTVHMWRAMFRTLGSGASALLYSGGTEAGHAEYAFVEENLGPASQEDLVKALGDHLKLGGLCSSVDLQVDRESVQVRAVALDTCESRSMHGQGKPVCHFLRGLLGGVSSNLLGVPDLVADETSCVAAGADACRFLVHRMFA